MHSFCSVEGSGTQGDGWDSATSPGCASSAMPRPCLQHIPSNLSKKDLTSPSTRDKEGWRLLTGVSGRLWDAAALLLPHPRTNQALVAQGPGGVAEPESVSCEGPIAIFLPFGIRISCFRPISCSTTAWVWMLPLPGHRMRPHSRINHLSGQHERQA